MTNLILSRRGFLAGLGSLLAAPAVVKAENLMPIFPWPRRGQRLHRLPRHADPVREGAMDLDLLLHPPRATMAEAVAALCARQLWARLANDRHYLLRACGRVWTDPNDPNRYVIPVRLGRTRFEITQTDEVSCRLGAPYVISEERPIL